MGHQYSDEGVPSGGMAGGAYGHSRSDTMSSIPSQRDWTRDSGTDKHGWTNDQTWERREPVLPMVEKKYDGPPGQYGAYAANDMRRGEELDGRTMSPSTTGASELSPDGVSRHWSGSTVTKEGHMSQRSHEMPESPRSYEMPGSTRSYEMPGSPEPFQRTFSDANRPFARNDPGSKAANSSSYELPG